MKKLILLPILFLVSFDIFAQKNVTIVDNESSVGFGIAPITAAGTFPGAVYNIDYCKLLNDYFVVGGSFALSGNRSWHWDKNDHVSKFAALMGVARANYVSEQYFKCYVVANLGILYGSFLMSGGDIKRGVDLAWYGGFGVEFGDLWVFFAEVGAGNKGALSLGLRARF